MKGVLFRAGLSVGRALTGAKGRRRRQPPNSQPNHRSPVRRSSPAPTRAARFRAWQTSGGA